MASSLPGIGCIFRAAVPKPNSATALARRGKRWPTQYNGSVPTGIAASRPDRFTVGRMPIRLQRVAAAGYAALLPPTRFATAGCTALLPPYKTHRYQRDHIAPDAR